MKYALTNGVILDGAKDMQPQTGKTVLIDGEKIAAIVPDSAGISGYTPINLKGKYLMPGLINMHVHLAGNGKPQKKQRDNEALVKKIMASGLTRAVAYKMVRDFAKLELLSGVTTIRTVGGLGNFDTRLRGDIAAGRAAGPRILAANQGISVPGGHMAGSVAIAAHSPEEALKILAQAESEGVDLVKLMITGGVLDAKEKGVPGELKMPPEMVRAVCEKAHRDGYTVAAHVESPEGVKVALQNGVDSIEHGAKPALANDIPVVLGNDVGCPWITQYDFWRELFYFHKYVGVSNAFALHTATQRAASCAGLGDVTGAVKEGLHADLIVTKENPLEDLRALRHVDLVMADGRLYDAPKFKTNAVVSRELDRYLTD